MKRRWLVCSVVLLSLVLALPASTQTKSVLLNGNFEVNVDNWVAGIGSFSHTTTTTHNGSDGAGALTPSGAGYGTANQCIDISGELGTWPNDGGTKYLTIDGYISSYEGRASHITLQFFTDTVCGEANFIDQYRSDPVTTASWTYRSVTQAIPGTAQSFRFQLWNGNSGQGIRYFDDLRAFSSTATAVKTQGIAARTSLWAAGLVGVVAVGGVLGRRKKETGCRNK